MQEEKQQRKWEEEQKREEEKRRKQEEKTRQKMREEEEMKYEEEMRRREKIKRAEQREWDEDLKKRQEEEKKQMKMYLKKKQQQEDAEMRMQMREKAKKRIYGTSSSEEEGKQPQKQQRNLIRPTDFDTAGLSKEKLTRHCFSEPDELTTRLRKIRQRTGARSEEESKQRSQQRKLQFHKDLSRRTSGKEEPTAQGKETTQETTQAFQKHGKAHARPINTKAGPAEKSVSEQSLKEQHQPLSSAAVRRLITLISFIPERVTGRPPATKEGNHQASKTEKPLTTKDRTSSPDQQLRGDDRLTAVKINKEYQRIKLRRQDQRGLTIRRVLRSGFTNRRVY